MCKSVNWYGLVRNHANKHNITVVISLDGQFCPPFAPPTPPSTFPPPPPNICFLVLTCLAHLFFLTLHPHTAQSTSSWLYTFFFSFISSLCSAWYFCHNSLTFSALFPAHFSLWARHPLQVAFPPRNISNPLCPLHFQHCFFSTSSTTISPHAIPCFVVFKCFALMWLVGSVREEKKFWRLAFRELGWFKQ